jgi:prevent-host-death family protein
VVEDAIRRGPQFVSQRGVNAVVILSTAEYEALVSNKLGFKDFLLSCPKVAEELVFERHKE